MSTQSTQSDSSYANPWRRPEPGIPIIYYSMANSGRPTLTVRSGCEIIFSLFKENATTTVSSSPPKHECNVISKIGHGPNSYASPGVANYTVYPSGRFHSNDSGPPISLSILGEYHPPRDIGDFVYGNGNGMHGGRWAANSGEEVGMREQEVVPRRGGIGAQNEGVNMANIASWDEGIQQQGTGTPDLNSFAEVDNYYDRIWRHGGDHVTDSTSYKAGPHFFQSDFADVSNGRDQTGASNLFGSAPVWYDTHHQPNPMDEQHEWKNPQGTLMEGNGVQGAHRRQETHGLWNGQKYKQWHNPESDQWHQLQQDNREWYNLQMQNNEEQHGSQNSTENSSYYGGLENTPSHRSTNETRDYNSHVGIVNETQRMNLQINAAVYGQQYSNYQYGVASEANEMDDQIYQHGHYLQGIQRSQQANANNGGNYSQANNYQLHELINSWPNVTQEIPDDPLQYYQL